MYTPIAQTTPPDDGTWILLRGRNAVGVPMVPVVAAWRRGEGRATEPAWRDSANLKDVSYLVADEGADWAPLPE